MLAVTLARRCSFGSESPRLRGNENGGESIQYAASDPRSLCVVDVFPGKHHETILIRAGDRCAGPRDHCKDAEHRALAGRQHRRLRRLVRSVLGLAAELHIRHFRADLRERSRHRDLLLRRQRIGLRHQSFRAIFRQLRYGDRKRRQRNRRRRERGRCARLQFQRRSRRWHCHQRASLELHRGHQPLVRHPGQQSVVVRRKRIPAGLQRQLPRRHGLRRHGRAPERLTCLRTQHLRADARGPRRAGLRGAPPPLQSRPARRLFHARLDRVKRASR